MDPPNATHGRGQVEEFRRQHRTRLVTLVFTDIVESTRLKHTLGDHAGAALIQQHRTLVRELLRQFPEGEEIETAGDSFLLVFSKPSAAVTFALGLLHRQQKLTEGAVQPVALRIGIHLGEVVVEEHEAGQKAKDLYGVQIDTCARVMSLAKPNQVLVSRGVFDSARQVLKGEDIEGVGPLEWLNHGPYLLKGIEEPVEVCEVRRLGQAGAPGPPTSSEKAQRQVRADEEAVLGWRPAVGQPVPSTSWVLEKKLGEVAKVASIAVLPFKDMSPQHDQGYICEGLAEELINALAQVKGLKVAARTSAFSFQGKSVDVREVGRQLNVGSILEGSVQKSGNRLRVTVQLVNVSDGYHLLSERFDRSLKDVFSVQDEITLATVEKLKVKLLEGEKERVTKRYTRDERAYEVYLKGRYHWNRRSPKDMILAVGCFQRAVEQDPCYAMPYVGMADVFNMLAEFGFVAPREAYLKSRALLQKAQAIDDSLSEVYASLALITYCYEWDLPAAEGYARRAIELNPLNFWALGWYAEIVGTQGRVQEAFEAARKGVESDPLSAMTHALFGIILGFVDGREEGRKYLLKTLAMEPDQPMFHLWLGMAYLMQPKVLEKASEHLQRACQLGVSAAYGYLGMAYALAGRKEEALKCLRKLESIEQEPFIPFPFRLLLWLKPGLRQFRSFKRKYCPAYLKAFIYCGMNQLDEALAHLEESCQARDYLLPVTLYEMSSFDFPGAADFVASPRFQALQAQIKK